MNQYQRNPDGSTFPPSDYPRIPLATHFQTLYYGWQVPEEFHYYTWSTMFNRWRACVSFTPGQKIVTSLKLEYHRLFDRLFMVAATFTDTPMGTDTANRFMFEHPETGVLDVKDGKVIIAYMWDKGIKCS